MKIDDLLDLNKLLHFTKRDAIVGGKKINADHKKQIQQGIDANGLEFLPYTARYAHEKKNQKYLKRGQISTQTKPPNLTLTGQMLNAFKYLGSSVSNEIKIEYGITDDLQAKKMIGNNLGRFGKKRSTDSKGRRRRKVVSRANSKREVAKNQKVGPFVESSIVNLFAEVIGRNIKKLDKKTIVVVHKI